MSLSKFDKAREAIRAQGYKQSIETRRLAFVDLEEQQFWRRRKREAEKKERQITARIEARKEDREQRQRDDKLARQLHRSLARYEELPEGA